MEARRLSGSEQTLDLRQPFNSGLPEGLRMQSRVVELAQRATEHVAAHTPGVHLRLIAKRQELHGRGRISCGEGVKVPGSSYLVVYRERDALDPRAYASNVLGSALIGLKGGMGRGNRCGR